MKDYYMCSNIIFKKDIESKKCERRALSIVDYSFSKSGNWIYKQEVSPDYGTDCSLEYIWENGCVQGDYFRCQVKGRTELNFICNKTIISFPIEVSTYNMAIRSKTLFLLILVNLKTEDIYFMKLNNYGEPSKNKKSVNIHIPIENSFPKSEMKLLEYL